MDDIQSYVFAILYSPTHPSRQPNPQVVVTSNMNEHVQRMLATHAAVDDNDDEAVVASTVGAVFYSQQQLYKRWGGPRTGKAPNIDRGHASGHAWLMQDYFCSTPFYPASVFRRRFRMSRAVFDRLLEGVTALVSYFVQAADATGRLGLTPHQKVTAALRVLSYGITPDAADEYVRIAESTAMKCVSALRTL